MARIVLLVAFFTFFSAVYCATYKCAGVAMYKLSFYGKWSNMTHPNAFPPTGKFSPLVGCSHGNDYTTWASGTKASPGVKAVAETGDPATMTAEILAVINTNKTAWKLINTTANQPIGNTAHVMNIAVEVTQDFPYVSLITMIAPSPDWFTGIMKTSLCDSNTGKWEDSLNITMLSPWDAGTENGNTFNTTNNETDPHVDIFEITKSQDTDFNKINGSIPTLGQLMFQRTNKPMMTQCSGEQKYMVKVEALWSEATHQNGFPTGNSHFSRLVIATHTYRYKFWSDMTRASSGVKEVAETGNPDTLYNEIMDMKKENFVSKAYKGDSTFNSPGKSATIMITVKDDYTLMSFISMIAPSPDWFVGLDSYDLCGNDGQWKDNIDMNLLPWDAGTDSGTDFESDNVKTMPVGFITRITASSNTVIKGDASKPFAKITIKKYTKPTPDSAHGLSAGVLTFLSIAFLAILRLLY